MFNSRLISLICGFTSVSLAFAMDHIIDGHPGFGSSQFVIFGYGLTWILVAYLTPPRKSLSADCPKLVLMIVGGIGLFTGLNLHQLLDGNAHGFWSTKLTTLILSATVIVFAIFGVNKRAVKDFIQLTLKNTLAVIIFIQLTLKSTLFQKYIGSITTNTGICLVAISLCLGSLEFMLRSELLVPSSWISVKHQELDRRIDQENIRISRSNRHGFSDRDRTLVKIPGVTRIAVLGDSAIFGDGVPNDVIWSHRLEKKILTHYKDFELLSWGKNGWSTLDQFDFLTNEGVNYQIDHLIIAWVTNDPDLGDKPQRYLTWQDKKLFFVLRLFFPNAFSYVSWKINNVLMQYLYLDYGYPKWEQSLYTDNNLERYFSVLKDFRNYCMANKINLTVVLAPHNHSPWFKKAHSQIIPMLESLTIPYLNLYPYVKDQLGHFSDQELKANPGDGHPGEKVTAVFSNEVFNYLKRVEIIY